MTYTSEQAAELAQRHGVHSQFTSFVAGKRPAMFIASAAQLAAMLNSAQATPQSDPVAWMDDFGNAFPLAANKGAGSWLDEHKRNWNPLYATPQNHIALLRRALQSLQYHTSQTRPLHDTDQTITAIKKALEQKP